MQKSSLDIVDNPTLYVTVNRKLTNNNLERSKIVKLDPSPNKINFYVSVSSGNSRSNLRNLVVDHSNTTPGTNSKCSSWPSNNCYDT